MEIQGESRFRVDNGDEIKIIQDDLPEGFEEKVLVIVYQ